MKPAIETCYTVYKPDDACWDRFVSAHPAAHFLQSSRWRSLKSRFGWWGACVAVGDPDGTLRAGASVLFRRMAGLTLAYVPRGPVVDWADPGLTSALLAALDACCRQHRAAVLKIEPGLVDTPEQRALLAGQGFRPSQHTVQPRSTIVLDIQGEEEAILQRMKSKWRYNIRLAARKGVMVREATRADLPQIHALMAETGERDGFGVHAPEYYTAAFDLFVPESGVFLLAEYQGEPLAAIVVLLSGDTAYYVWGASSNRERNRMPNHALQWAAIRWARQRGARRYDLWGIPDELGQVAYGLDRGRGQPVPAEQLPVDLEGLPGEGLWGVYRFKQGFGGHVVRWVGAWDRPLQPVGARLYQAGVALQEVRLSMARKGVRPGGMAVLRRHIPRAPGASLQVERVSDPVRWRRVLASLPDPHVLQSWEWGEVKRQTGWNAGRFVLVGEGDRPQGAFQFLWRQPLPFLPLRIGYVPKGPLLDWEDPGLVDTLLGQVEAVARQHRCLLVKIDPDVREDRPAGQQLIQTLRRRGWRFSQEQIQFKNTALTDLRPGEAELLAQMKGKWRYNIRLAERRGIEIRQGGAADLPAFYALYAETARRDGFLVRPYAYYETAWETFLQAQADAQNPAGGVLLLAEHPEETEPLAGIFLLRYGQRCWYFYGASSSRRRRDMPNYLLQWEAMRWARRAGCSWYDWWGAPTCLDDPDDAMQGVWYFKQGFGAEFQPHVGAWDYAVQPWIYRLYVQGMPWLLAMMRWRGRQTA